jgi:SAM-dependent methyltransferase
VIQVREAFDRHAAEYDRVFSGAQMRREVWECADQVFQPGNSVLDVGCGTGDDALHFVSRGINVTAIDISPLMIAELNKKACGSVAAESADMQTYVPAFPLDGVFSNFGALNCVRNLDWLQRLPLRSGGYAVLTVMGRLYPLEFAVSLLKGQPRLACRRMKPSSEAVVEGVRFSVYYHSLRTLKFALEPKFELLAVRGLSSLLPAPHLEHLWKFRVIRLLKPVDRFLCSHSWTAQYSDHFVSVWRRHEA